MSNNKLNTLKEPRGGTLCESNGFLVPVLTESPKEMGAQYGALMGDHMQNAYDILITPGRQKGRITDDDARKWTDRMYSTASMRYRLFYDGLVDGNPLESTTWWPTRPRTSSSS